MISFARSSRSHVTSILALAQRAFTKIKDKGSKICGNTIVETTDRAALSIKASCIVVTKEMPITTDPRRGLPIADASKLGIAAQDQKCTNFTTTPRPLKRPQVIPTGSSIAVDWSLSRQRTAIGIIVVRRKLNYHDILSRELI